VKAPRGAWLESGGGHTVYVVDGTTAARRTIETGAISVSEVEIVQGVRPGERVILSDTSSFGDARNVILH